MEGTPQILANRKASNAAGIKSARDRSPGAYQERSPLGVLRSAPHELYSEL